MTIFGYTFTPFEGMLLFLLWLAAGYAIGFFGAFVEDMMRQFRKPRK